MDIYNKAVFKLSFVIFVAFVFCETPSVYGLEGTTGPDNLSVSISTTTSITTTTPNATALNTTASIVKNTTASVATNSGTEPTTPATTATISSTTGGGTISSTTPATINTTTPAAGTNNSFDIASFIGGIVVGVGILLIVFFICRYIKGRQVDYNVL